MCFWGAVLVQEAVQLLGFVDKRMEEHNIHFGLPPPDRNTARDDKYQNLLPCLKKIAKKVNLMYVGMEAVDALTSLQVSFGSRNDLFVRFLFVS